MIQRRGNILRHSDGDDAGRGRLSGIGTTVAFLSGLALAGCSGSQVEHSIAVSQANSGNTTHLAATSIAEGERSPAGTFLAGMRARSDGDFKRAADFYESALGADPENMALTLVALRVALADGRYHNSLSLAQRLVRSGTDDALPRVVLAAHRVAAHDYSGALPMVDQVAERGATALLGLLVKAWVQAGLNEPEQSSAALEVLSNNAAVRAFAAFHGALIAEHFEKVELAEVGYGKVLELTQGGSLRTVEAYGAFLRRQGRPDDAKALYADYLARDPGNPLIDDELVATEAGVVPAPFVPSPAAGLAEAFFNVAGELARENANEEAVIYTRLALLLRPDFPVALSLLASIFEALDQWETAVTVYREIAPGSAYEWNARMRIASNLAGLDRMDEAHRLLQAMAAERPQRTDAVIALGDMLRGEELWEEAVAAYDDAFSRIDAIHERDWALFYTRGIALERAHQWERAEQDFLKALELRPDQPFVLNYLGYSWIEQERNYERALDMLRKATSLRPRNGYITDSLGWVYYRLGNHDEAVRWLERAAELVPDDPVINDHLGDAYWRVGRYLEARFQWRRALSFQPEPDEVPRIEAKLDSGLTDANEVTQSEAATGED